VGKKTGYNDDITFKYSLIGKAVLKLPRYVKHDEKMYSEHKKNPIVGHGDLRERWFGFTHK